MQNVGKLIMVVVLWNRDKVFENFTNTHQSYISETK